MLLPKPSGCHGCPAYGDGQGFVPDEIRPNAPVVVWAQSPGEDEEAGRRYLGEGQYEDAHQAPLIGKTGKMMERTFLPLAGLNREDCSFVNSIRCRVNHKNTLPQNLKHLVKIMSHCHRAHFKGLPEEAKVIVAMGEPAAICTTQTLHGFNGWRGYVLPFTPLGTPMRPRSSVWTPGPQEVPVLITHHLAYLWKEPTAELPMKRDWNKVPKLLDRSWPEPMPSIFDHSPDPWPTYAAFDTEWAKDRPEHLVRYSLATKDRMVWVVEAQNALQRATIAPGSTIIMHNAPADLPHLERLLGNIAQLGINIEDSMYANAVMWTGKVETEEEKGRAGGAMSHSLNFLGSLYARINRWKHLAKIAPRLYSGGDALGTMQVWDTGLHGGLKGELERDPQSKWVYENLQKPLIPIIMRAMQRGIATNQGAVKAALSEIKRDQSELLQKVQAYCGWPINLRSPKHLAYWLYTVEGLKVKRPRRV